MIDQTIPSDKRDFLDQIGFKEVARLPSSGISNEGMAIGVRPHVGEGTIVMYSRKAAMTASFDADGLRVIARALTELADGLDAEARA